MASDASGLGIALEVAGNLLPAVIAGIGAYIAVRIETTILKTRMDAVDRQLQALGSVLTDMAKVYGRLDRMDDRAILQGGRIDELGRTLREMSKQFTDLLIERIGHAPPRSNTGAGR